MPYRTAGIDVHKKKLAVVVADVEVHEEYQFERRWYGSNPEQLQLLSAWLVEQQVEEVVMESTSQYWKPVWEHWNDTGNRGVGARRNRPDVGNPASGAGLVQSWSARAQERLSRCGTSGKAACVSGADLELCARYRTASVANTHAHKVS